jgi:MFS family permease
MLRKINLLHLPLNSNTNTDRRELNRHTQNLSIQEGAFWAILWGFGESYLVPVAIFLGASNATIAFVGTAPVLIMAFAHVCGALLLDRVGRRRPIITAGFSIQGLAFLPLLFLPFAAESLRTPILITVTLTAFFAVGLARPSWVSLMGDVVDPDQRGAYFSRRERIVMLTMVLATLSAGVILQQWKQAGQTAIGFAFLFGIAMLGRCIGVTLIHHHFDAPFSPVDAEKNAEWKAHLRAFFTDINFVWFTVAIGSINGIFCMAAPFFAVRMLEDLHWSYVQFTWNTVVFMGSQALFIRWWGTLCDRHGTRCVMIAASWLLCPFLLIWVFFKNFPLLLCSQILSGAAWSGLNLAASNFIYDAVGQQGRAKAFSFYSMACGLFSVTGGMLVGAQLTEILPTEFRMAALHIQCQSTIPPLFFLTAIICVLARIVLLPRFSEVKQTTPMSTTRILFHLMNGQPLRDALRAAILRIERRNKTTE